MLVWAGQLLIHVMLLNLIKNKWKKNGQKLRVQNLYLKLTTLMRTLIKAMKKD
jgi:uncharacterized protein (DUF1919 family)